MITETRSFSLPSVDAFLVEAEVVLSPGLPCFATVGPPGSGMTMLAQRLPGILPLMTFDEALETSKVLGIAGLLDCGLIDCAPLDSAPLSVRRPFRAPCNASPPSKSVRTFSSLEEMRGTGISVILRTKIATRVRAKFPLNSPDRPRKSKSMPSGRMHKESYEEAFAS